MPALTRLIAHLLLRVWPSLCDEIKRLQTGVHPGMPVRITARTTAMIAAAGGISGWNHPSSDAALVEGHS